MSFIIPDEQSVTLSGFVSTGAFSARDIAKSVSDKFEEDWTVFDREPNKYEAYGDSYKVTITVERV